MLHSPHWTVHGACVRKSAGIIKKESSFLYMNLKQTNKYFHVCFGRQFLSGMFFCNFLTESNTEEITSNELGVNVAVGSEYRNNESYCAIAIEFL